MKKEHLPPEPKQNSSKEQKTAADNLKFMRSVVEKSYRKVKPETHDAIMWGLICMITYVSIHFLVRHGLQKWIPSLYLSLMGVGICGSFITMFIWIRKQKEKGFVPILPYQLGGICLVVMLPIIFWDRLGLFKNVFCGAGFIYAMGLSIIMGVYGMLYAKAGLLGQIIIFVGMLFAFLSKDYACPLIVLGLSTGAGFIIPAVITHMNYRKWEKNYEQRIST